MIPHNAADTMYARILFGKIDEVQMKELEDLPLDIDASGVVSIGDKPMIAIEDQPAVPGVEDGEEMQDLPFEPDFVSGDPPGTPPVPLSPPKSVGDNPLVILAPIPGPASAPPASGISHGGPLGSPVAAPVNVKLTRTTHTAF